MPFYRLYTTILGLAMALALAGVSLPAAAQPTGRLECKISENGRPASGTMTVERDGTKIASGGCGEAVSVKPGTYQVTLQLDGALDRPKKTTRVQVRPGAVERAVADFGTGTLQCQAQVEGRRAAAMAKIYRDGRLLGSLGMGVGAHLSAGTYNVVIRYRGQEKRFDDVRIAPGQRRSLEATF